jgi:hypothetical protein
MDVCVRLFCVSVGLCVGRGHATGSSPYQEVLPTVYRVNKLKKAAKVHKGCRDIDFSGDGVDIEGNYTSSEL